ncbi:tubulin-like doman-containing protein [Paenibacillus sp. BSR1-1]|uniref:tubulin-like doman-containing protein n=1 Tax=Paenibacillus sp. BSR1-1 TaxID=3020845 RepID=UPI0025B0D223|nr:tubulin-like doman-containing protein [Paenibacillus sp. BSR1-1]MDN3015649.1 tubulin-like doman-containing protein [Paenibacillus sp. BSR1-1]
MSFNVPTILIGLGGIGSNIANMVYGRIPPEQRGRVAIHAFDTDAGSIAQLDHLRNCATQTSTNHSVNEYLQANKEVIKWFPNNPQIKRKTMTDGAGQVRAVSRLAFRSAMSEGKLNALWDGIERIFPVDSDSRSYNVRVIIISSLVGGTGSGIFLQIALYLREMLERKLGSESVLIRGAFLLPDILVRSNTLDQNEWEAVQGNGYASLKELNAITLSASGNHKQNVTIELEYRPNQIDLEGRTAHAITDKHLPYDFCFLFDYENTKGQHLTNVSEYMEQVARTVYLQLFSPISAKSFSQEDNQIRSLVESNGQARYCGSGVASLTYPYEDILDYCALQWSVNGLNDTWLRLDQLFHEEKKRHEDDERNGIHHEKPLIRELYVKYFDQIVNNQEKPNPFFRQLDMQVHQIEDKGKKGSSKADLFLHEVEEYAKRVIKEDEELKEDYEEHCKLDAGKLKIKDQAKQEINRMEAALEDYAKEINKKINENSHFIAYQVIDSDYHSPNGGDGSRFHLNTWLLKEESPIHPVGVRYILYSIHNKLIKKISSLREENRLLKEQMNRYQDIYDLDRNDGDVDDAVRRVDKALKQGFLSSMFRNNFKDFINEYTEKATHQFNTLNRYKYSMLLEQVFSALNQSIKEMIGDWQRFFDNLMETKETLTGEIYQLARKFEGVSDPTKTFVLADKEMLEQTWERIRQSVDNGFLPESISQKIYLSLYNRFIERKNNRGSEEFYKETKVEEFFKENVVAFCRKELANKHQDQLDLTIIQALKIEAGRLGKDVDDYLYRKIKAIEELAQPFVPITSHYRSLKFWGLHSESFNLLSEMEKNELFNDKQIVENAFERNEIVCYRAHYGLSVSDFSKFSSGKNGKPPGVYYEAYHRLVNKLNEDENRTITPHLDRNWHLPAYMPDLNPERAELETNRTDRALILGVIYGWLQLVNSDGKRVYQYSGNQGTKLLLKFGEKVEEDTFLLHEALPHNPVIYDEILERFQETQENQIKNNRNIEEHDFILGALEISKVKKEGIRNILDLVLAYDLEFISDPSLTVRADRLRQCLLNEIVEYFMKVMKPDSAKREAAKLIKRLWAESLVRYKTAQDTEEFNKWMNDINHKMSSLNQEQVVV